MLRNKKQVSCNYVSFIYKSFTSTIHYVHRTSCPKKWNLSFSLGALRVPQDLSMEKNCFCSVSVALWGVFIYIYMYSVSKFQASKVKGESPKPISRDINKLHNIFRHPGNYHRPPLMTKPSAIVNVDYK